MRLSGQSSVGLRKIGDSLVGSSCYGDKTEIEGDSARIEDRRKSRRGLRVSLEGTYDVGGEISEKRQSQS